MSTLPASVFNDAIDATFSSYSGLSPEDKQAIINFLRNDAGLEAELSRLLSKNPALVSGDRPVYVFWADELR